MEKLLPSSWLSVNLRVMVRLILILYARATTNNDTDHDCHYQPVVRVS